MEELQGVLINALLVLVPVVTAVLVNMLRGYLDTKKEAMRQQMDESTWYQFQEFARLGIQAAEQYRKSQGWTNEQAKEFVVMRLREASARQGFPLPAHEADLLVEGVYRGLKGAGIAGVGQTGEGETFTLTVSE